MSRIFFLNEKALQERTPAALAKRLHGAEKVLRRVIQQRNSFELIIRSLERPLGLFPANGPDVPSSRNLRRASGIAPKYLRVTPARATQHQSLNLCFRSVTAYHPPLISSESWRNHAVNATQQPQLHTGRDNESTFSCAGHDRKRYLVRVPNPRNVGDFLRRRWAQLGLEFELRSIGVGRKGQRY